MAFTCSVVSPNGKAFEGRVSQAIIPAHDGLMGILTDRAPLLVRLGPGPVRLDLAAGSREHFFVDGGVAQVKDNVLTLLTTGVSPLAELDYEAAAAELKQAAAGKAADAEAEKQRLARIERARAKMRAAAHQRAGAGPQ